jgi:phosphoribosylformylglycinamidine cyclo-ligase
VEPQTYAGAGVNIERAEAFVTRLKKRSGRAEHEKMWQGAGGYASVYPMNEDQAVAVTTDGVGTKLLVAGELKNHSTIGIDLVAMVANDLICVGATPTIFLDYFAVGHLQDKLADAVIEGIVEGCDQAGMILAGGETAEMPGLYAQDHYDLAGFAVGQVTRKALLTGQRIKPGQTVIAVGSSGIHSNGLSLARSVLKDNRAAYARLLTPTLIYVKPVVELFNTVGSAITGIAHITGGGWRNIFRLNDSVGFTITDPLPVPEVLSEISKFVADAEMYKTFNMGMGLVVIADGQAEKIVDTFCSAGFNAGIVGKVTEQAKTLTLEPKKLTIHD